MVDQGIKYCVFQKLGLRHATGMTKTFAIRFACGFFHNKEEGLVLLAC